MTYQSKAARKGNGRDGPDGVGRPERTGPVASADMAMRRPHHRVPPWRHRAPLTATRMDV